MSATARSALVSGAASGIGAAIASRLSSGGYDVVVADRDGSRLSAVADRLRARAIVIDIADEDAVANAFTSLERLDVLVNSAGIATEVGPHGSLAEYRRTLDVNLTGALLVTRAVLPLLRASRSPRVLNIGSIQGLVAARESVAYATSKGALHSLTQALAVDLAADGVLVNALAPGFVDTPMAVLADGVKEYDTEWFRSVYVEHGRVPLRRPGTADEVAAAAEFLVSESNSYITGAILPVDGGLTATF